MPRPRLELNVSQQTAVGLVETTELDAVTDLAFESLKNAIGELGTRKLNKTSYVLTFAEIVRSSDGDPYPRLRLKASLPSGALAGITIQPDAQEQLQYLIEQPRDLRKQNVARHLRALVDKEQEPLATTLYSLLDDEDYSLSWLVSHQVDNPWHESERRSADLLGSKRNLWKRFDLDVAIPSSATFDDEQRNALDLFVFMEPDIAALSLPFVGSPCVHCYLGVTKGAYESASSFVEELHARHYEALRQAVWPFLFARLTALATDYMSSDLSRDADEDPVNRSGQFLVDAGGLLLASEIAFPRNGGFTAPQQTHGLPKFGAGETLEIELPESGWGPHQFAKLTLPKFSTLAKGKVENQWVPLSSTAGNTSLQKEAVQRLLKKLVESVYMLTERQAKLARQERGMRDARDRLKKFEDETQQAIRDVNTSLRVGDRFEMRQYIEALAHVLTLTLKSIVGETIDTVVAGLPRIENYQVTGESDCHHVLEKLGQLPVAIDTEVNQHEPAQPESVGRLLEAIHEAALQRLRSKTGVDSVPTEDVKLARALLTFMHVTRIWDGREHYESLFGVFKDDRKFLSANEHFSTDESHSLLNALLNRNGNQPEKLFIVNGRRDRSVRLIEINIASHTPYFAAALALPIIGVWPQTENVAYELKLEGTAQAGRLELSFEFAAANAGRVMSPKTVRRAIDEGRETVNPESLSTALAVFDCFYEVDGSHESIEQSGFNLSYGI